MATDSCLILYGNSVFLAGIQAGLKHDATFELIALDTESPEAMNMIRARRPRAVLFDLNLAKPDFAIPLLLEQSDLLLIGVDASRDELLVLTSHPVQALSIPDLVQFILEETPCPNGACQSPEGFHS